jgi:hypothetical protein
LPLRLKTNRIALCPKSAVGPNMHGQPPSITVRPRSRRYAVAFFETLPAPGPRWHPHVLDPEFVALAHRLLGNLGPCSDHDRLDSSGNRTQVVVGAVALHLVRVRVDREDLVAALTQARVDDVAAVVCGRPRDARDSHAPGAEELGRGVLHRCHRMLLSDATSAHAYGGHDR